MNTLASLIPTAVVVLLLSASIFYYLYYKRNNLFKRIGKEYGLQVLIYTYNRTVIGWGNVIKLRKLEGMIKGKHVMIEDFVESYSIVAPWWYSGLGLQLSTLRFTQFSVGGKTENIGKIGLFRLQSGFAEYNDIIAKIDSMELA